MEFDHIILEQEQEDLLCRLVEATRNVPRRERRKFFVAQSKDGTSILHNGLEGNMDAYIGNIEALDAAGLISMSYGSRGTPNFYVTPLGFRYYEHLKHATKESTRRVTDHVRQYIEAEEFQQRYPNAWAKWQLAESSLWSSESQRRLTEIGHHCREAMQEFADTLVNRFDPPEVDSDKAHTINRIKAVLGHRASQLGSTVKPFLEALISYWRRVNYLVQRQEHGAQKEGEPLVWEDARRVVFQTLIVMYEIDRAL